MSSPPPPSPPLPPDELPSDPQEFKMPALEDLLKAIEGMEGMSEEDKEKLRDSLTNKNQEGRGGFMGQVAEEAGMAPDLVILLIFLMVIALIFDLNHEELMKKIDGLLDDLKTDHPELVEKAKVLLGQTVTQIYYRYLLVLGAILIISLLFVFFGYKLYKSLAERERRREEKRRQKQQKKKNK